MGRSAAFLDDLVAQKIVAAVKAGATRAGAAKAAKIGRSTLQSWLQKGRDGEEPYVSFLDRIREAEGDLEKKLVGWALKMAESAEHEPTRAKMIEMLLNVRCGWAKGDAKPKDAPANDVPRDAAADLDVARSVVAALESRAKVA